MKPWKCFILGLPVILLASWAMAHQEPTKATDQGPSRRADLESNRPRPRFLKIDTDYIDTNQIVYAELTRTGIGNSNELRVQFQSKDVYVSIDNKENVASMLRWLDGESFSPPPQR